MSTRTASCRLAFDVTEAVGFGEPLQIVAELFWPAEGVAAAKSVVVCLPGGTYTRAYYHFTKFPGYSMAESLAAAGHLVLIIDHLGTGESSRPSDGRRLSLHSLSAANREVARQTIEGLLDGTLVPGQRLDARPLMVGVGHSMGGMLTVAQQAVHKTFDAVGILGWSNLRIEFQGSQLDQRVPSPDEIETPAWMMEEFEKRFNGDFFPVIDRPALRHLFYWEDVPEDVIAADEAEETNLPGVVGGMAMVPGAVAEGAARITVPTFVCFGERDVSPDPKAELALYASAPELTYLLLPRSGHCQSFASTRQYLWDRLAAWVDDQVRFAAWKPAL